MIAIRLGDSSFNNKQTNSKGFKNTFVKPDVNKFANQVSEFFGTFFREVKTSADEFASQMFNDSPPETPIPTSHVQSLHSNQERVQLEQDSERETRLAQERAAQEEYELQLAMALSLSEAEKPNV